MRHLLLNIINIPPDLSSLLSGLSNSVNERKSEEWWQKINLPGQKKIKVMQWTTWKLIIVHGIPLPRLIFTFTFRRVLRLSVCFHKHSKNTPNIIKMSCFIYGNICSSCMKLWSHVFRFPFSIPESSPMFPTWPLSLWPTLVCRRSSKELLRKHNNSKYCK